MKVLENHLFKKRAFELILYLFLLSLFLFSVVYYKERIFYYDTAFQFFKIIFFNDFNIEAHRYSTAIVQLPTILALKAGVSLKSLSIIFSSSFVILYSLIFLFLFKVLKINFAAVAFVLSLAMGTSLGFFHTVTEIHQGIAYSFLFLGLIYVPVRKDLPVLKNDLLTVFAILAGAIAFLSHPTSFFLLLFILGYYIVDQRAWKQPKIYLFLFILLVGVAIKVFNTDTGSYEGQLLPKPTLFISLLPKFWTLYGFKFFYHRIFDIYFFTVSTGIIVVVNYVYHKKWLKLLYFIFSTLILFFITIIIYHEGNADIAMERIFLPLNVFVALPFCKDLVFKNEAISLKSVFYIAVLFVFSFAFIFRGALHYEKRTDYLLKIVSDLNNSAESKFIAYQRQFDMEIIEIPWAFSTETLLLSSLDKKPSKTIYVVGKEADIESLNIEDPNTLLVTDFWLYWDTRKLNKDYFNLKPGVYQRLKTDLEY